MKYLIVSFLILGLVGCSQDESGKDSLEIADLQEFYFPLNENLRPTTYKYEVITETQDGSKESYEYLKFQKLREGNYSFSRYGSEMNLLDSTVFKIDQIGTNITQYYLTSEENSLVKADVSPKLNFPWKRKIQDQLKNEFKYQSKMYGALTESSVSMKNSFEGFEDLDNSFSKDIKCAKISIETETKFKNVESDEVVNYSSKGEVFDLKGVGLYKSVETNNYGVTITKKLIEIKKST
jgi:hypothetical protein